jgi:hypothetical protein
MEQVVQVHCNEGVAIRIGPEPCAGTREGVGEASAGGHTGQPLSHERVEYPDADAVQEAEGNTRGRASASASAVRRGRRTWHVCTLHAREPGDLRFGPSHYGRVRIGKARSRSR